MSFNPADLFLEKVAEDPPEEEASDEEVDRIDPGEQAIIGLTAVSGNTLANATRMLGNMYLANKGLEGSTTVPRALPVSGMKYPSEYSAKAVQALEKAQAGGMRSLRKPVLGGLFSVSPRAVKDVDELFDLAENMTEIEKKLGSTNRVVRSFIDKYKLPKKGVRIDMSSGLVSDILHGPHYSLATKRVALPQYSKAVALHELGHAADYTKGLGKVRRFTDPILSKGVNAALPIALVAGDEIKKMIPGTLDDRAITFMQDNAPAIMGATLAATELYPEAKASVLALKHIAKEEGRPAAMQAFKRLGPAYGTYLMSAIPAIVGMAIARKFMRQAREINELEEGVQKKEAGVGDWLLGGYQGIKSMVTSHLADVKHVGKEIAESTVELARAPDSMKRVGQAAKNVGTSPEFVHTAITSAVPAAMAALYLYGSTPGGVARERFQQKVTPSLYGGDPLIAKPVSESWREENPALFAGLVGAGAALSGGILAKFFSDIGRVI